MQILASAVPLVGHRGRERVIAICGPWSKEMIPGKSPGQHEVLAECSARTGSLQLGPKAYQVRSVCWAGPLMTSSSPHLIAPLKPLCWRPRLQQVRFWRTFQIWAPFSSPQKNKNKTKKTNQKKQKQKDPWEHDFQGRETTEATIKC